MGDCDRVESSEQNGPQGQPLQARKLSAIFPILLLLGLPQASCCLPSHIHLL